MAALLESLKALGVGRLIAMAAVAGAMLLMVTFLALHGGGGERMALLYADMDLREAAQVSDLLDRAHVTHEAGPDGTRISVPASEVARARLLLAKDGLPSGGSIGYEIFDRGDGLTATQFQQTINQTRALEGELARSIRMISGVRGARVHLVLPKREPFARDRVEPQASVVLTMAGAARMDREGVQSVLNLVASAVPGLRPQGIGIIDSRGNLLARPGEGAGTAGTAAELRAAAEQRLSRAVEDMLERTVGAGRVRAETAVEMDYNQVHETEEKFDPEGKVERSTQNTTSTNKTTEANAAVSVANNLPNADAGANPAGSQEQHSEETTNYEIGKTVRTTTREQPMIRRISLAVLVDQVATKGTDGVTTWQDRSPDELGRIAALARTAIGFDEKRGDRVEVVSLRFVETDAPVDEPKLGVFGLPLDKADLTRIGQTAVLAIIAVLALLLVLRPMVLRLTTALPSLADEPAGGLALAGPGNAGGGSATGEGARTPGRSGMLALTGPDSPGEDESMVRLGNIDGAVRASSLRSVAELVDKHPEESLAVMRGWMVKEGA